jgi:hypothetical protein
MVMTSATEAYPLSDAERKDREALLKRLGVNFAPAIAEIIPLDHEVRKRRPLGLAPGGGSSEPIADEPAFVSGPSVPSVAATLSAETLARGATMADVVTAFDALLAIDSDGDGLLRAKIAELRGQVSELKGALIEAKHEIRELRLVQESLRISTRGESGRDGMRGIPGRDGLQGPIGPRGERGDKGLPAPRLATWNIDEDRFIATPVFGDGSTGAPLNLLPLFQSYDQAVSQIEDHDLVEAAHEARVENERQIEAHRWAK